jgi:hypothetical protein
MNMAENTVNEAASNLIRGMREANQAIANSLVAAQDRNVKYTQSILVNGMEVLKSQAAETRSLMQELLEISQRQQDAFQGLAQGTIDTYIELLRVPFTYYKEAMEFAEHVSR